MPVVNDIVRVLEELAPPNLAESWDNVGLMLGSRKWSAQSILCALDLNEEVVDEAIHKGVNCIVTHHPFFFKPMRCIDLDTREGKMIEKLLSHQIAVYSMHTNYDIANGGLNDYLAQGIGLQEVELLSVTSVEKYYKCVIYVPTTHYEQIRKVIVQNNKTTIGEYKGCTFTSGIGEGSFIPLEGSNPYIGETNKFEVVKECQISFISAESELKGLLDKIKQVHPYEEMAYDVFELQHMTKKCGIGRVGVLKTAISLDTFIEDIKAYFNIPYVRVAKGNQALIKRVALCSGSGSGYILEASQKADVYITGDVKFHEAQMAQQLGLTLIDVGHYTSENRALQPIVDCIYEHFTDCEVILSKVDGETLVIR